MENFSSEFRFYQRLLEPIKKISQMDFNGDLYTPISSNTLNRFPKVFSMEDFDQLALDEAEGCKNTSL
jgi:hypothetical protein